MVRHSVSGNVVETVGVIIQRAGSVERVAITGRTRVLRCSGKEGKILRHFCSSLLRTWYSRESAAEVPVSARNQRKGGVHDNRVAMLNGPAIKLHPKFVKPISRLLLLVTGEK